MNKAPKVLTRMRLSCCWGDNLNEKELNDVVDYINGLEQQCKKQKEVIDKIKNVQIEMPKSNYSYDYMIYRNKIDEILKEVSE